MYPPPIPPQGSVYPPPIPPQGSVYAHGQPHQPLGSFNQQFNQNYQNQNQQNQNIQSFPNYNQVSHPTQGNPPPSLHGNQVSHPTQGNPPPSLHGNQVNNPLEYPPAYQNGVNGVANSLSNLSVTSQGFNKLWGIEYVDLLKQRQVLPPGGVIPPEIRHANEFWRGKCAGNELFRCTMTKIPETKALLQKSRLPLGILIHPFKDLTQLPVIQCSTIVRCRSCRTYINPFVYFVDARRWKCNLCFRVNDLPEEFQYDPLTKTYGDPTRRPEVNSGTIEFLAPADYMVRPPQAAVYLFVLETTSVAVETGYLKLVCDCLLDNLELLPGDARTQIGFITFNKFVQFYNLSRDLAVPAQINVPDLEEPFAPSPDNLLVPLKDHIEQVRSLLQSLPLLFNNQVDLDGKNCLGAAIQIACKIMGPIGGRITLFQATLPNVGPGALSPREHKGALPSQKDLNPATDFYKKLALDCSSQYVAVDVFFINDSYCDIASVSCISKFSGGSLYRLNRLRSPGRKALLEAAFLRYLTRKIGFEAVMRVRCTRGLSIHTFHGNLFVRSTDLLSLPNCNPDAGFGMQVSIDEDLRDFQHVCFQAALLYTSAKGERRIRVHTLCLPTSCTVPDILHSADQTAIIALLSKMGVDRALSSTLQDSREAFTNAVVDILTSYCTTQNSLPGSGLIAPPGLQVLPTYVHALLRSVGFRMDNRVGLDDRVAFFNDLKALPIKNIIQSFYPDLYPIHQILNAPLSPPEEDEEGDCPSLPLLNLCSDRIDAQGAYLLDQPELILIYVGRNASNAFCSDVLNVPNFGHLADCSELPELDTVASVRLRNFVNHIQAIKPFYVPTRIIREDSGDRVELISRLIEDRGEGGSPSYYEYLQQIKNLVK